MAFEHLRKENTCHLKQNPYRKLLRLEVLKELSCCKFWTRESKYKISTKSRQLVICTSKKIQIFSSYILTDNAIDYPSHVLAICEYLKVVPAVIESSSDQNMKRITRIATVQLSCLFHAGNGQLTDLLFVSDKAMHITKNWRNGFQWLIVVRSCI